MLHSIREHEVLYGKESRGPTTHCEGARFGERNLLHCKSKLSLMCYKTRCHKVLLFVSKHIISFVWISGYTISFILWWNGVFIVILYLLRTTVSNFTKNDIYFTNITKLQSMIDEYCRTLKWNKLWLRTKVFSDLTQYHRNRFLFAIFARIPLATYQISFFKKNELKKTVHKKPLHALTY